MKNFFKKLFSYTFSEDEIKHNTNALIIIEFLCSSIFLYNAIKHYQEGHPIIFAICVISAVVFFTSGLLLFFLDLRILTSVIISILIVFLYTSAFINTVQSGFGVFWVLLVPFAMTYLLGFCFGFIISTIFEIFFLVYRFVPSLYASLSQGLPENYISAFCLLYTIDYIISLVVMGQNQLNRFRLHEYQWDLEKIIVKEKQKVSKASMQTIVAITNAIQARDTYTGNHSQRVAFFSGMIASKLPDWDVNKVRNLMKIAMVHDIGKIGIENSILNKREKLTDEEYEQMKSHTTIGAEILKDLDFIENVTLGAKYHHEKYDGSGYPCGLKGTEIPIEARIIGIADAFDAMNVSRIYREKCDRETVLEELKNGSGTQFDPELLNIFLEILVQSDFFEAMGDFSVLSSLSIDNYLSLI